MNVSTTDKEKAKWLSLMFPPLSESICLRVLKENNDDVDKSVDHILTIQAEGKTRIPKARKVELFERKERLESLKSKSILLDKRIENEKKQQREKQEFLRIEEEKRKERERLEKEKIEEMRHEEEERWKKELAAETRRKSDVDRERARRRNFEIQKMEDKILIEEQSKERRLKEIEEERKRRVEEEIMEMRAEKQRIAEEARLLEEELRLMQQEAELERSRKEGLRLKSEELAKQKQNKMKVTETKTEISEIDDEDEDLKDFGIIESTSDSVELSATILAQTKMANIKFDDDGGQLPMFNIYIRKFEMTPEKDKEVETMKEILNKVGVKSSDIREIDVTTDFELTGYLKAQCGGDFRLPMLCMRKERIGSVEELKEMRDSGKLNSKLELPALENSSDDEDDRALGVLDRALEGVENIASYLNPMSWLRWGMGSSDNTTDSKAVEIEVIHTNWYWRHLRRVFKFGEKEFYRMHPKHSAPRATHQYQDIQKITIKSSNQIILDYENNSSPDWLRCAPEDLQKMVSIIKSKVPNILIEDLTPK